MPAAGDVEVRPVDSWDECPLHRGGEHPEVQDETLDREWALNIRRDAYRAFRDATPGLRGSFNMACELALSDFGITNPDPQDWVDAANWVFESHRQPKAGDRFPVRCVQKILG